MIFALAPPVTGFAATASADEPSESVPVLAYGMEEGQGTTVLDSAGGGAHGTLESATWSPDGRYGKALSFSGGQGRLLLPASVSSRLSGGMTFEAWVRPADVRSSGILLSNRDDEDEEAWNEYVLRVRGDGSVYVSFYTPDTSYVVAGPPLPRNVWSHLAVTHDGFSMRLFINGNQIDAVEPVNELPIFTNPWSVAGYPLSGGNPSFQGLVDEVRLYDAALSEERIRADMATRVNDVVDAPPSATGPLTAIGGPGEARLSWGPATDDLGVTGYQVHRSTTSGFEPSADTLVATVATPGYADLNLEPPGMYYYRVRAVDFMRQHGPLSGEAPAAVGPVTRPLTALVAAYGLNEGTGVSVDDSSTRNNDGLVRGAVWADGKNGKGLFFPEVFKRVTIPDSPSLRVTTGLTMEMWIKPQAPPTGYSRYFLNKEVAGVTRTSTYRIGTWGGTYLGAEVRLVNLGSIQANAPAPPVHVWTHIAVTYDGQVLRLYYNGVQQSQSKWAGTIAAQPGPLYLGEENITPEEFMACSLDDVRIYSTALTAAQIRADMNEAVI
ncbi:hypothetical protein Sru01_54680 [Sphaerisporangium rufum]|uniref:Fibronectin type-III domain-containing protein n=1 Tax=Sphaerisporangium rufum TaxID=1381558 RepID=A0A919V0V8_9ACTN|nr:LamG domain-containing protein [Sphaerisporangium rufum]GII80486.1 hypothetical protein Sru01_54680 [Sphaerisporangium rufum]